MDIASSLEQNIAIDLFQSFMLGLAISDKESFSAFMRKGDRSVDILANILIKNNICTHQWEARMAVLPVLLARGFTIAESPPEDS